MLRARRLRLMPARRARSCACRSMPRSPRSRPARFVTARSSPRCNGSRSTARALPISRGRARSRGSTSENENLRGPRARSAPSPACGGGVGRGCLKREVFLICAPPPCPSPASGGGDGVGPPFVIRTNRSRMSAEVSLMLAILLAVTGTDPQPWAARLRALAPQRDIRLWPDHDPADIAYACAWHAPRGLFARLPHLKVIFSLGAGVDHVVADPDLPDVPVVRIVDPDLTMRMTEYVVLHVLAYHRRQRLYDVQQRERVWHEP